MEEKTKYTPAEQDLIKRTILKSSDRDEFTLFMHTVEATGLDPLRKQIYAVKRKNKKTGRFDMTIQTGIDGYRIVANRTRTYAGNDDPVYDNEEQPRKATVTVYKVVSGVRCPFTASARWDQYYPGER